jgi:hypothetical protein
VADQLPPPPLTKKERQEKKGKVNIWNKTQSPRGARTERKWWNQIVEKRGRASKTKYGEKEMLPFIPDDEVRSVNASSSLSPSREK